MDQRIILRATITSFALACASMCVSAATVSGTVRDSAGLAVANTDVVLFHGNNLTTCTRTGTDGTFSVATKAHGSTVHFTAGRIGYGWVAKTLAIPNMPTSPIGVDLELKHQESTQQGLERLCVSDPPLVPGLALEATMVTANSPTSVKWKVETATAATVFSPQIQWQDVDAIEKEGAESVYYKLTLTPDICGVQEHLKLRVEALLQYSDNTSRRISVTRMLSRRSTCSRQTKRSEQ